MFFESVFLVASTLDSVPAKPEHVQDWAMSPDHHESNPDFSPTIFFDSPFCWPADTLASHNSAVSGNFAGPERTTYGSDGIASCVDDYIFFLSSETSCSSQDYQMREGHGLMIHNGIKTRENQGRRKNRRIRKRRKDFIEKGGIKKRRKNRPNLKGQN
jgi:hypothetical protein